MADANGPSIGIDMDQVVKGVAQRAAASLAEAWVASARYEAAVTALLAEKNAAVTTPPAAD